MTEMLPDPETEFGARVARRLRVEPLAWLTTVDGGGRPQPAPVWFLWDEPDGSVLVYSDGKAKRLAHLRSNPRVALHFDGDGQGGDIVVLTGEMRPSPDDPPADRNAEYLAATGSAAAGRARRTSPRSTRCRCGCVSPRFGGTEAAPQQS